MSTRCQIAFYEEEPKELSKPKVLLYRHSDGYPEGVVPDIKPFLEWWEREGRGIRDIEYVSARLLQYLCNKYDGHSEELRKENNWGKEEKGFTGETGYGICKDFHRDIEYLYVVYPSVLKVYEVQGFDWEDIDSAVKLIETIKIC